MPISDYKLWLHGKAYPLIGVDIGHSGDEYSEDEIDFGVANPNVGQGNKLGVHIIVNEAFATMVSAEVWVMHGTATAPTTKLVGRYFAVADLTAGKHYFIPLPPTVKQFVRVWWDVTTSPTTGQICMWIGPDIDGTE